MATQTRGQAAERGDAPKPPAKRKRGTRTTPALFYRQVVAELRKVLWPTRSELVRFTLITLVFCVIVIAITAGLDDGFTKLMFAVFG